MGDYLPVYSGSCGKQARTATAAIRGGQLVEMDGANAVRPASAGSTRVLGVASIDVSAEDAASGGVRVTVFTGGTQRLKAGAGGVVAGDVIAAGADGTVVAIGAGTFSTQLGIALTSAAEGAIAEVQLDR
jgi:hypothetical protein